MKMLIFYPQEFLLPCSVILLFMFMGNIHLVNSLECVYCPPHSTEDDCNELNLTQICLTETKCGFARFVEKRKDLGELYPEGFEKEVFLVTVKKGCMEEDYCTKEQAKRSADNLLNSTECIFCEQDMCALQFPILCVECDEAEDKYCGIQTGPIKQCSSGEVCFRQRTKAQNFAEKRGCIESSHCLKQDFCEYCSTDICWTDPIPAPSQQSLQPTQEKNNKTVQGKRITFRSLSTKLKPHWILILVQFAYMYF